MKVQRSVVLGVTGSIAAYKSAELVRLLVKTGVEVQVIMTEAGAEFIAPMTLATLAGRPVTLDLFDPPIGPLPGWDGSGEEESGATNRQGGIDHIRASREADLIVVAPATANILGKVAHGIADDALSTTIMASTAPVLFAPAMNTRMWENPAVQENLRILERRGYRLIDPPAGELACGEYGAGRMAEPSEILGQILREITERDADAPSLLVTTGGTEEPIDPVRILANNSSGRMGFAIAEAGRDLGYRVTVIQGRTTADPPPGVDLHPVRTASEMGQAVRKLHRKYDVLVMAAAVSDYRPKSSRAQKIRSGERSLRLDLVPTVDILESIRGKRAGQVTVGFALETSRTRSAGVAAAREKLTRKGVDLIVLNNPQRAGSEFGGESNEVTLLGTDGRMDALPVMSKYDVGVKILEEASALLQRNSGAKKIRKKK